MDYSYGSKGILVSGKAKERQQYEIGYMDDNKLVGLMKILKTALF